jgi:hypothetical protein
MTDQTAAGDRVTAPLEPMKRFTIDVPVSLQRRNKAACPARAKYVTVLRDLST